MQKPRSKKDNLENKRLNRIVLFSLIAVMLTLILGYKFFEAIIMDHQSSYHSIQIAKDYWVSDTYTLTPEEAVKYNDFKKTITKSNDFRQYICPDAACGNYQELVNDVNKEELETSIQDYLRYKSNQDMIKNAYCVIGIVIFGIIIVSLLLIIKWHLLAAVLGLVSFPLLISLVFNNYPTYNPLQKNLFGIGKIIFSILMIVVMVVNWIFSWRAGKKH